jgi:tRNA pseudouridine38-40 synthase
LDYEALVAAAAPLRGEHDFRGFSAKRQPQPHYRCNILVAQWEARAKGEGFIFTIEADRFLHRMVRFLVGTMVDAARGRRPASDIERLLNSDNNAEASPPAPSQGLYFIGARYPRLGKDLGL